MLFVYDRPLMRFLSTESRDVLDSKKIIGSARRLDGGVFNHPASARSFLTRPRKQQISAEFPEDETFPNRAHRLDEN